MLHDLRAKAYSYLPRIIHHAFNQELRCGTLPKHVFQEFVYQDQHYLAEFYKRLREIAARLPNKSHKNIFLQLADLSVGESNMLKKTLDQPKVRFFKKPPIPSNSTIAYYIFHLENSIRKGPIEAGIASLIPCFYIYSELGVGLKYKMSDNNPYQAWIESYSSPKFLQATHAIMGVLQELTPQPSAALREKIMDNFIASMEYEIAFLNDVYATKTLPNPLNIHFTAHPI